MELSLIGYYQIPESTLGLDVCINPPGLQERTVLRTWNNGTGRLKLILHGKREGGAASPPSASPTLAALPAGERGESVLR